MSKLQNISGLLVAINSDYTKDVVVTTKTTRAELTKMLQAAEYALTEVLPRMEGYVNEIEDLEEGKQNLLERNSEMLHQVGKLNREVIELKDSIFNLEEQKEELEAKINNLTAELSLENTRCKRAEHKVETMQAAIDMLKNRSFFERLFNKQ
jgi:chromosome segregation ATPase